MVTVRIVGARTRVSGIQALQLRSSRWIHDRRHKKTVISDRLRKSAEQRAKVGAGTAPQRRKRVTALQRRVDSTRCGGLQAV